MTFGIYQLHPFSPDLILSTAKEVSGQPIERLYHKPQISYLIEYLKAKHCKQVILEAPYVDRSYLEDYVEYYARCFPEYGRFCTRIHFLDQVLDDEGFRELFASDHESSDEVVEKIVSAYLGFSVFKPLPDAFLGRTCIATYKEDGNRFYPTIRTHTANIAGHSFTVDSLAFQEQDTVVAACATSALWSALDKAGRLFDTRVSTPAEITRLAGGHAHYRTLPSHGLEVGEMCHAIKSLGLEVELREGSRIDDLKGLIYGYGSMGVPLILGLDFETKDGEEVFDGDAHAVTVSGYRLGEPEKGQKLVSERINRIYVHDDQHGPFSKSDVIGSTKITTKWVNPGDEETVDGNIQTVIIPVYHKIRITYEDALLFSSSFDVMLRLCGLNASWDIRLFDVNSFRHKIRQEDYPAPLKERMLTSPSPRFIWRATALVNGEPKADLLMDATDIERGFFAYDLVFPDPRCQGNVKDLLMEHQRAAMLEDLNFLGPEWVEFTKKKVG